MKMLTRVVVWLAALAATGAVARSTCRCIPGDACWPSQADWVSFNRTIGGKLVATEMLASSCHVPYFNETQCQSVQELWNEPIFHDDSSSSIMAAAVANNSCDAFTDSETPCLTGNAVAYAVNATGPADFSSAIKFAKRRNLRLVIRNTGHDYMGKSTGKGALSIWTHHMKDVQFLNYTADDYTGPAVRVGAGIQVEEAYRITGEVGSVIVSGACQSVGFAGGFVQGGGHSGLSSLYGLAADQTLEFDVVDGSGNLLKANRRQNSDLYWALSGGGGGTYGVVVAVTVKLFPDTSVTGVQLAFEHDTTRSDDFFNAVQVYRDLVPTITARGGMSVDAVTNASFAVSPLTLPGLNQVEALDLLSPFLTYLNQSNIPYNLTVTESDTYYGHWNTTMRNLPGEQVQNAQYGGWSMPLDIVQNQGAALSEAMKTIIDAGCIAIGMGLNASQVVDNAVHPGWRDMSIYMFLFIEWPRNANLEEMAARAKTMTEVCVPALSTLSPDTGAYMNEGDPNQPNWKEAFFGPNYARLLSIKKRYDPDDIFYAHTAVGSDEFMIDEAGRLCHLEKEC